MTLQVEQFRVARDLVVAGWTQGALARTKAGFGLARGDDSKAVCWCAEGALERAGAMYDTFRALVLKGYVGDYGKLADWNDRRGRTKEEVLAMFDKVIADLEAVAV